MSPIPAAISTQLIHHPYQPPEGFAAPQVAIHKASTVYFPSVAAMRQREWKDKTGYTYGLHGTPTTFTLEERLATLEGGKYCMLLPSGLAALTCVDLALLQSGDEMLVPHNVYGARLAITEEEWTRFGIRTRAYDAMDVADLAAKITDQTKLVWLEAAGSVTMEFPDLIALTRVCRERGVLCALDNTWGAGLAFCAFDLDGQGLGVDISTQALTKFPSGGGDVLMGSVVTRDDNLALRLKLGRMRLGLGVAANDVELILRNLPSIEMRYRWSDQTARRLALWLQSLPQVEAVLHPALAGAPGHENWRALCRGGHASGQIRGGASSPSDQVDTLWAAGLFSIVLHERYSPAQVDAFVDALKLFKIGYSWGGPVSLAVPYDVLAMRPLGVSHWPYRGGLVRLSIGYEGAGDLQADLAQALAPLS